MIKLNKFPQFCTGVMTMVLILMLPVSAEIVPPASEIVSITPSQSDILEKLFSAQVIYLGETHDQQADHDAQLKIIQALYQNQPKLVIALEMFQRPFQNLLDQYVAGKLTESQLKKQSQYQQRWGFPWQYYAPILQFAQQHQLPLLALNTPAEITRKVARQGFESLTAEEWQWIPPESEILTDHKNYQELLFEVYKQHDQTAEISSPNFERFFLAQVLWDETMADGIVKFMEQNPEYQVVVLAGNGHIAYGYGIPDRVKRRVPGVNQQSVIFQSPNQPMVFGDAEIAEPIADYIWQHEK